MSEPKITANKLGEYMTATPSRRRQIIKDHKKEESFIFGRYSDARSTIVDYLAGEIILEEVSARVRALENATSDKDFIQNDKRASAVAIENFMEVLDEITLTGCEVVKGTNFEAQSIEVAGVTLTAKPDVLLVNGGTKKVEGYIKLHFSKTSALNENSAGYVATVMKTFVEAKISDGNQLNPARSFVVDVPTQSVFEAPKAHKKRLKDVQAACEEISAGWK